MKGYTLFEMLIVLSLLAGLSMLAYPSIKPQLDKFKLQAHAQKIVKQFNDTRLYAMQRGEEVVFCIDMFNYLEEYVRCYPDGTIQSKTITLDDEKYKLDIKFDSLTQTAKIGQIYHENR